MLCKIQWELCSGNRHRTGAKYPANKPLGQILKCLMKFKLVIPLILFFTFAGPIARTQQSAKPLTKNQIMELVKAGMGSAQLAGKVKQVGIDFDPTEDYLKDLRQAGAQEVLVRALREIHPKPLTRDQVLQLVVGDVPSERAADLVKQHGIDFEPDQEYLETLRVAGAQAILLTALRSVGRAAPEPGTVRTNPKDGAKYVWIPPGTFLMGCSERDDNCQPDEMPAHEVTITR